MILVPVSDHHLIRNVSLTGISSVRALTRGRSQRRTKTSQGDRERALTISPSATILARVVIQCRVE